jgi:hypothetical protein
VERNRAELSIHLQGARGAGVVQDVPSERLLKQFPDKLRAPALDKPDDRAYNLANYDVIIAFDPDWTQLIPEQQRLLEKWVSDRAGGLVVIGGPQHTFRLAQKNARQTLGPILDLYPVVPADSRVQQVQRPTDEPWRLNFCGETPEMTFLRLDAERRAPLAGWDDFFTDGPKKEGEKATLVRGFYTCHPVERIKEAALVVATFGDPRAQLANGKEHPYLVTMSHGKGRVVWIGSGETWRLRQYSEAYHERFWTQLVRYTARLEERQR